MRGDDFLHQPIDNSFSAEIPDGPKIVLVFDHRQPRRTVMEHGVGGYQHRISESHKRRISHQEFAKLALGDIRSLFRRNHRDLRNGYPSRAPNLAKQYIVDNTIKQAAFILQRIDRLVETD